MLTAMFGELLFTTRARSKPQASLLAAIMVAGGALWFTPLPRTALFTGTGIASCLGLWAGVFALVHYFYGCRISVRRFGPEYPGAHPRFELRYREAGRKGLGILDIGHITGLAITPYPPPWWRSWLQPRWDQQSRTLRSRQFGYTGPGLAISYVLPPYASTDQRERTVMLPCRDAETLKSLLDSILVEDGALSA